jgi:hypothetical protein
MPERIVSALGGARRPKFREELSKGLFDLGELRHRRLPARKSPQGQKDEQGFVNRSLSTSLPDPKRVECV